MFFKIIIFGFFLLNNFTNGRYEATWESLDSRASPEWYDEAKFGIFMHWGVYSVPGYSSEWLWYDCLKCILTHFIFRYHWKSENPDPVVVAYMEKNYPKDLTYFDFAKDFKAMDFNASNIAEIVQATGARYFVFTSKHHEGFTMFPSKTTFGWNSVDVGPKRDIVMELKVAIEETKGVKFGLYFSLMAWFHQLFLNDVAMNRTDYVEQQSYPQLLELTNKYKPQIIWSDGDWDRSDTYWKSKEFLAWLFNDSPVSKEVVVNDRWGSGCMGKHGGFLTFADNYDPGVLILRKWENCDTIDKYSWGYRKLMSSEDVSEVKTIITSLVRTISCGGNYLLNVGPDSNGRLSPIFEDRLRKVGAWVKRNSQGIFKTTFWKHQNDIKNKNVWFTTKKYSNQLSAPKTNTVFAFVLDISESLIIEMGSIEYQATTKASIVGLKGFSPKVTFVKESNLTIINLNGISFDFLFEAGKQIVIKFVFVN